MLLPALFFVEHLMNVNKYSVLLMAILTISGCVRKEEDISVGKDYEAEKTEEYTFYDLKPKKEESVITATSLPPLTPMPLWEHDDFIKKLEQHVQHKIKSTEKLIGDWAGAAYEVETKADLVNASPEKYIDQFATTAAKYAVIISELYPNKHYKILKLSLELPDSSKIIGKFQLSKLIENSNKETYLIMDSVLETEKADSDTLAGNAINDSCKNILSKELNPFFCGDMKKIIILDSTIKENREIMQVARKTKHEKFKYGFDNKEVKVNEMVIKSTKEQAAKKESSETDSMEEIIHSINNETLPPPPAEAEPKSSLSKEEIKALEEAGFEVKLN